MAEPIVNTKQGKIKGTTDTDLDGGTFYKFVGIPFAKPPVGPLRFKAPQPPEAWQEIRDCTKDTSSGCIFFSIQSKQFVGSEDCLYLNVFTKEIQTPSSQPKPVMVFIHGGGFTLGAGTEMMLGPNHLLTEDIVLVTFSYRTGIFGFLSTDDSSLDVPGNAGLKDQTAALKWVQENISSFNGDKDNVTIFGVSAGGASVSFQVLSPSAKGLFHKAIAQSGSALNPWTWGQKNSVQVAEKLGKKVSTEKEAVDILMDTPAKELLQAALEIKDAISGSGRRPYGPVIEVPNATAFLTDNPFDLYNSGNYSQVPMIQGIVNNEGMLYDCIEMGPQSPITPQSGLLWHMGIEDDKEKSAKIGKLVEEFYFKDGINKESIYKFFGDASFLHGIVESTKLISRTSAHPVYLYVYSRESDISDMARKIFRIQDDNIKGVGHGGDQMVLFSGIVAQLLGVMMNEDNKDAAKQLVKMWADFARTGKPHQGWEPVTDEDNLKYFDINKDAALKTNPFEERFAFWDRIFKDVPNINARLNEKPKQ